MRNIKLLAMILTFFMALTFLGGCSGGASAPTTEEPTTTTTAAPTPTPEPTPTPTPTPPVEKWATDERLYLNGLSWFVSGSGQYTVWTFDKNNTGFIFTMLAAAEEEGGFHCMQPIVFKYSVISDGKIRIVYSDETYNDYKYEIDGKYLQLERMDSNDTSNKMTLSRRGWF